MITVDPDYPYLLIGRALHHGGILPRWHAPDTNCTRDEAEAKFTSFICHICENWGLEIKMRSL